MKVEALNCPNCGAAVADEAPVCGHCRSRLKTVSCIQCLETVFEGSKFCPFCGSETEPHTVSGSAAKRKCPRCSSQLVTITASGIDLDECISCAGVWCDVDTFEAICSDKERQSAVLRQLDNITTSEDPAAIRYVPCPVCGELMNRNNFARVSGVIIDTCKPHGLWFDARELPRIIEFIRKGGLDAAREKEKRQIAEERDRLKQEKYAAAVERFRETDNRSFGRTGSVSAIREFINFLLD